MSLTIDYIKTKDVYMYIYSTRSFYYGLDLLYNVVLVGKVMPDGERFGR